MKKILSVLLAVLVMATSCVCAVPASAADECTHDEISRTVYVYTAGENSTYTKTDYCYDANCKGKVETGNAGAANRCPRCYSRTLEKEEIVYANCIRGGYTEFTCTTCQISFKDKFVNKKEHNYIKTITAATCTTPGSTDYKCNCTKYGAPMDATKSDGHIPAKGHTIGKAGTTVTYTYGTDDNGVAICTVTGTCMDCGDPDAVDKKLYVIAEGCPACGAKVTIKTVDVPVDCNNGATITYACVKGCKDITVTALPVGHEVKSTTYYYGETTDSYTVKVNCYRCGIAEVQDDTYKYDTKCKLCDSALVERVVVAPTCSKTGYTQTTCAKGEKCIEATRPMLNHVAKVGEWNYHIEEGIYTYGASCSNYGCFGYSSSGQIGIVGKCEKCKATGKLTYKKVTFADCISREYTNFKCNQCCPGSEDIIVDKNTKAHNTVSDVKAPTCTEAGGESTTCKNCYSTTTKETIPAKGHSIDISNKIYMKPAVDSNGNIIYDGNKIVYKNFLKAYGYCKVCNRDIETALSTVPACERCIDGKIIQEVYIKPDCSVDLVAGIKGTNGHTRVYCSNGCHDKDTIGFYIPDSSIIPFAHVYGDWTVTKAATCSEPGVKVRTCSLCGGKDEVVIPVNTNDNGEPKHMLVVMEYGYPATCTEDGRTNHTYCSQCGEFFPAVYIPATGHLLSPGTTNKNFCSRCNSYVIDEQEEGYVKVPLLDENGNPVYKIEGYETEVDEKGNTVYEVEHDEKGDVIYEKDIYGKVKFDEDGKKIPVYKLDKYGQKIPVYKYDKNGNRIPIYAKDTNGNPIPLYKEVVCSCMCHNNDGLAKFFFKIIMFFCNIFGINQECDCGISHMMTE